MKAGELRKALESMKDQQMTIENAIELLMGFSPAAELPDQWDSVMRKQLGWDKPIVLPMPKGRGARRG